DGLCIMKTARFLTFLMWGMVLFTGTSLGAGVPEDGFALRELPVSEARDIGWEMKDGVISTALPGEKPQLLLVGNPDWNDYEIAAMVQFKEAPPGAEAGLVLQASDKANYIVFSLARRLGGPFAVLRIENSEGTTKQMVGDQTRVERIDLSAWHEL